MHFWFVMMYVQKLWVAFSSFYSNVVILQRLRRQCLKVEGKPGALSIGTQWEGEGADAVSFTKRSKMQRHSWILGVRHWWGELRLKRSQAWRMKRVRTLPLVKRITNLDAPWEQAGRVHR